MATIDHDTSEQPAAANCSNSSGGSNRQQQNSPPAATQGESRGRTSSGKFRFSFRKNKNRQRRENEEHLQKCSFVTRNQAEKIESELLTEFSLSLEQLFEHGGMCAALAFARLHPREAMPKGSNVLVCCGPGNNGGYGLSVARYLKIFGYKLTLFYPKSATKSIYKSLLLQCEKLDIPFLSYMPGDVQVLDHNYHLIVDALFGFTFEAPVREDLADVLKKLQATSIPIVSIDVPSGWEADKCSSGPQLKPETLISLFLPKKCSIEFSGRHCIAGRLIPATLASKLELQLPNWQLTSDVYQLLSDSPSEAANQNASSPAGGGAAAAAASFGGE